MKKILYFFLPILTLKHAEKVINQSIEKVINNEELPLTLDEIKKVKIEEIEKFYDETFLVKKTLEDKAKLGMIGVTITTGLVYAITSNHDKLSGYILVLLIIALFYSLTAGYLALSILSDKNQVYKLSIKDLLLTERVKKDALLINYSLNIKKNIIRQNYVYSSYKHLIYALIIIIIGFSSNQFLYKEKSISIGCQIISKDINKTIGVLNTRIKSNEKTIKLLSKKFYCNENKQDKKIEFKDDNLLKSVVKKSEEYNKTKY